MRPQARLEDALLSPGCDVAGTVRRCVLSPGVVVEAGAEVVDSVLLHNAVVRRGARVRRAVLDERVEVCADVSVGGGGDVALVGSGSGSSTTCRPAPASRRRRTKTERRLQRQVLQHLGHQRGDR